MFGTNTKNFLLLENMLSDAFDIIDGKRNSYRYVESSFSDKKFNKINEIIKNRINSFMLKDQKDMLAMGELVLSLDHMKTGVFKESKIVGYKRETYVMAVAFNDLTHLLNDKFEKIGKVLDAFTHNDFTPKLELEGVKGEMASLIDGINLLREELTFTLSSNLSNGIDLQTDASSLKQAVEALSTASNQQAASLEETAAAMEEMTSNVQNNASKA
ncbi:hypothetical protein, partial [Sulfurimonas sp. RIFOXYD12_FULL_33_39]|uniref:hypothetical protein n=2 Tax=unclassified Sulfurimonas TaxID=2623549 RepID=UPI0025F1F6DD